MALPFLCTLQPSQEWATMNKSDLINALAEKEGLKVKRLSTS